jgi:hypothetical protein
MRKREKKTVAHSTAQLRIVRETLHRSFIFDYQLMVDAHPQAAPTRLMRACTDELGINTSLQKISRDGSRPTRRLNNSDPSAELPEGLNHRQVLKALLWSADWSRLKFCFDVAANCGIVLPCNGPKFGTSNRAQNQRRSPRVHTFIPRQSSCPNIH